MLKTIPCEVLQRVLNESILVHNPDEANFSLVPVTQLEDTIPFYYTDSDGSRIFEVPQTTSDTVFYLYDQCNKTECDKLVIKYANAIENKINSALDENGNKITGLLSIRTYGIYKKCKCHGCRGCCCNGKEKAQDGVGNHGIDGGTLASSFNVLADYASVFAQYIPFLPSYGAPSVPSSYPTPYTPPVASYATPAVPAYVPSSVTPSYTAPTASGGYAPAYVPSAPVVL